MLRRSERYKAGMEYNNTRELHTDNKLFSLHALKDGSIFLICSNKQDSYRDVLEFSLQMVKNFDAALTMIGH